MGKESEIMTIDAPVTKEQVEEIAREVMGEHLKPAIATAMAPLEQRCMIAEGALLMACEYIAKQKGNISSDAVAVIAQLFKEEAKAFFEKQQPVEQPAPVDQTPEENKELDLSV
jgi:hypothetical protein